MEPTQEQLSAVHQLIRSAPPLTWTSPSSARAASGRSASWPTSPSASTLPPRRGSDRTLSIPQ
eukprot:10859821-Alexandrium_andersonii.AAC.1